MARLDFDERRLFLETSVEGFVAAWVETAALGRRDQIGRSARNKLKLLHFFEEPRRGGEKAFGIRMRRSLCAIYLRIRPKLDNLTRVHDADTVRYLGLERKVVGDEYERKGELLLQLFNRFMIWACTMTSRAVVGSSRITISGFKKSAVAMTARCFMPPESSWG